MSTELVFRARVEELRRRVEALPAEVEDWLERATSEVDFYAHHSQMNALSILMKGLFDKQRLQVQGLDAASPGFPDAAYPVITEIIRVQKLWDFFRDMLTLRFSPDFKDPLWVADTVAWNCHRPVLETAAVKGIVTLDKVREPPLTYITADFSPATWVRGSRPRDPVEYLLGPVKLPIPVIEIPADHLVNSWDLLSIPHEVGHDLERDLALEAPLQQSLDGAAIPSPRREAWLQWRAEALADLIALQLAGPAFAEALLSLLMLPSATVVGWNAADPHPNHYVRILMCAAYARTLVPEAAGMPAATAQVRQRIAEDASSIEQRWKSIYPEAPATLTAFTDDFAAVFEAVMDTPLTALKGSTVRQLMPYSPADDARIRQAAEYLRTGTNAPPAGLLKPRHCVSAARLAVSKASEDAATDVAAAMKDVNARTAALVRDNTPAVLRGSDSSAHEAFIRSFVDSF
jgi:hypothetical protein